MNEALLKQFVKLISVNTGLHIREQDRDALGKKILTRMKWLRLSVPEQYYQILETGTDKSYTIDTLSKEGEWKALTSLLTTGESYFFRDKGQFKLLENYILPELIERKRTWKALDNGRPSLRIWSAGCSTGEEPYSIAILLQEMIPDWETWDIGILGTDINQEAIKKAKRGLYSQWSFRLVDVDLQKQYFYQRKGEWEIDEKVRRIVRLRYGNLVLDNFSNTGSDFHSVDLIICRNVFVYFDSKAIATVIEKFYNTLVSGGYLMTAHAELHGQPLGKFQAKVFPESVVYQRPENLQSDTVASPSVRHLHKPIELGVSAIAAKESTGRQIIREAPSSGKQAIPTTSLTPTRKPILNLKGTPTPTIAEASVQFPKTPDTTTDANSQKTIAAIAREAETLFLQEDYSEAIKKAAEAIASDPHHFAAHYLMAQAYANLGEYDKAIHSCGQAISIDSLCADPYYLLAHLAEERGDIETAKMFFKRVIYLAPGAIGAYLELAALYDREGDKVRARKMRTTAVELLDELPPDATVDKRSRLRAGELLQDVQKMLQNHR